MANLTFVAPFFIVADLKASVAFYTEKLGFVTRYSGPDGAGKRRRTVDITFLL
ncbi:MAG TPA: VOC family protein [Puia sp.]|nr:VOC family protein [Puia sp.]